MEPFPIILVSWAVQWCHDGDMGPIYSTNTLGKPPLTGETINYALQTLTMRGLNVLWQQHLHNGITDIPYNKANRCSGDTKQVSNCYVVTICS